MATETRSVLGGHCNVERPLLQSGRRADLIELSLPESVVAAALRAQLDDRQPRRRSQRGGDQPARRQAGRLNIRRLIQTEPPGRELLLKARCQEEQRIVR